MTYAHQPEEMDLDERRAALEARGWRFATKAWEGEFSVHGSNLQSMKTNVIDIWDESEQTALRAAIAAAEELEKEK